MTDTADSVSEPLRVALIGAGNQGREHLDAIAQSEYVTLMGICDPSEASLQGVKSDYSLDHVAFETERSALLARKDIDAFIIATPHDSHQRITREAAAVGKHILKEKPIARTLEEAHELTTFVRQAGVIMHTAVQRRHHATYRAVHAHLHARHAQIHAASIDMTIAVKNSSTPSAMSARPKTWRDDSVKAGGGVLNDLGYHGVDLMHYLLGPLDPVSCVTMKNDMPCASNIVEDEAYLWAVQGASWVYMRFARSYQKLERVQLDTEEGRYVVDRTAATFFPHHGVPEILCESERAWTQTMLDQYRTFYLEIRQGQPAPNALSEQIPTMRFIEKCYAMRRPQGFLSHGSTL